jgi:hypothetical protein
LSGRRLSNPALREAAWRLLRAAHAAPLARSHAQVFCPIRPFVRRRAAFPDAAGPGSLLAPEARSGAAEAQPPAASVANRAGAIHAPRAKKAKNAKKLAQSGAAEPAKSLRLAEESKGMQHRCMKADDATRYLVAYSRHTCEIIELIPPAHGHRVSVSPAAGPAEAA